MNFWFKKAGWIHYPVTFQGVVITLFFLAFCVHIVLFFNGRAHSVSDFLYNIFPFIIPGFLFYEWIAAKKSK